MIRSSGIQTIAAEVEADMAGEGVEEGVGMVGVTGVEIEKVNHFTSPPWSRILGNRSQII
jgi:hypothetical protein